MKKKDINLSVLYNFVRGRQLEGTYSSDPSIGIWPITSLRIGCGWGCVPEQDWPYSCSRNWPPKEPPNLDKNAKRYRITCYQRVRSVEECKLALQKGAVLAAFNITNQWFNAKNGIIDIPQQNAKIVGSHAFAIVGYEDNRKSFMFQNSWGEEWGDKGYGWLPYEYFKTHLIEAWILHVNFKKWEPMCKHLPRIQGFTWSINTYMGSLHAIEFYDYPNDERMGWCFVVAHDGWLEVEEFFVRPAYRQQGYGKMLSDMLLELSSKLNMPLRLWISHADAELNNFALLNWLCSCLGLQLDDSGVRWASYRAELIKRPFKKSISIKPPSRPQIYRLTKE